MNVWLLGCIEIDHNHPESMNMPENRPDKLGTSGPEDAKVAKWWWDFKFRQSMMTLWEFNLSNESKRSNDLQSAQ